MIQLRFFGVLFLSLFGISICQFTPDPRNCDNVVCPVGKVCHKGACYCPTCIPSTSTVSTTLLPAGSACSPNPCKRNCVCRESCQHEDGYFCESPDGFLGKNCDIFAPILTCANNQITLKISENVLNDLFPWRSDSQPACFYFAPTSDVTSFTQNVEICRFCSESGKFYILNLPLPFQRCGTTSSSRDDGYLSYSNKVWANLQNGEIFDMPKHLLSFQCSYDRQYNVLTSLRPIVETNRAAVNDTMKLRANIELCKTSSACPGSCPSMYAVQGGAAYTVAETVHAIMMVQSTNLGESDFVILHNMHISCTSAVGDRSVTLVDNGCETSKLNIRINSRGHDVVCVSFKVPRVTRCLDHLFYIHAELRVVNEIPVCSKRGLNKRSIENGKKSGVPKAVMFVGPIYVVPAIDGVPDYTLYQDEEDEYKRSSLVIVDPPTADSTSIVGLHELTTASAIVGGIAFVLVIASIFVCIKSDRK